MDLENAMRVINGVSGFTEDDTGVGMAWLVVTDHIESQAATIARLEAELDKLRLQMVTEVTDAEAKSAHLEAELERVTGERDGLRERIGNSHIPGLWYGPLVVVDGPHPSVKSIVDCGSGEALIANIYHDNPRCAEAVRDLIVQAALSARQNGEGVGDE